MWRLRIEFGCDNLPDLGLALQLMGKKNFQHFIDDLMTLQINISPGNRFFGSPAQGDDFIVGAENLFLICHQFRNDLRVRGTAGEKRRFLLDGRSNGAQVLQLFGSSRRDHDPLKSILLNIITLQGFHESDLAEPVEGILRFPFTAGQHNHTTAFLTRQKKPDLIQGRTVININRVRIRTEK